MRLRIPNKNAMSPLVATVLLIAFAISLGVVVMSFGNKYYHNPNFSTQDVNVSTLCKNLNIEFLEINSEPQICYTLVGDIWEISYMVLNSGYSSIDGVQVWVVGNGIFLEDISDDQLQPGTPLSGKFDYDFSNYGEIKEVRFFPKIMIDDGSGGVSPCIDRPLKIDDIKECK